MKQKRFLIYSLLSFFCLFQLAAQQEMQPLPIDPQVRYGKLSNGLTYYIRHNELPKERADFYIAQNVREPARTGPLPGTHGFQRIKKLPG